MTRTRILDACCGSRMFWYDRDNKYTVYQDNRELDTTLCDGRKLEITPGLFGDFRKMIYADNYFDLVVFDPPHLVRAGKTSWLAKKSERLLRKNCSWMKTGKLILKQDLQSVLECCAHSERWFLSGIQSKYHLARL